ncbi:MAG TPA: hypothetical protein VIT68_04745 [Candidatus Gracilibacteria bacterium]
MKKIYLLLAFTLIFFPSLNAFGAVTLQSAPIKHQTLPRNAVRVPFIEAIITTDRNPATIESITVRRTGLSSNTDIDSVQIEGTTRRSFSTSVGNNDLAILRFLRGYYIPAYTNEHLTLYANLDVGGSNRTIGFEIVDIQTQDGSIQRNQNTNLSPYGYLNRQYRTNTNTTTSTSSYAVPELDFEILSNGGVISVGQSNRIGRFRVKNTSRKTVTLQRLSLRNRGSARLEDMFDTLELRDNNGWTIARSADINDNYAHFNLNYYTLAGGDSLIISAWGAAKYGKLNRTIQLVLDDKLDLSGSFGTDRYPVAASSQNRAGSTTMTRSSQNYILGNNSASVNTRARGLWNRNYNPGENQITFMAERMTFKAPVYLDRFRAIISPASRVADYNGNGVADREDYEEAFENFRLFINGQYIDQSRNIESANGKLYLEFSIGETFSGGNEFTVVGDVSNQAQSGDRLKITIDKSFSFPEWEYRRY